MSQFISRRQVLALFCGFPTAVAGLRYLQNGPKITDHLRKVIITSDDAGMCKAANEGTIKALQQGIVTSASIMTCCPEYEEFAEFAVQHPEYDYGVHLVLTCDLREQPWGPILGKGAVPTLVGNDGYFRLWLHQRVDVEQVKLELISQIERAFQSGIRISHLDHHMWVMFYSPEMLRLYVELGLKYNLPLRFSRTPPKRIITNPELLKTYNEQVKLLDSKGFPILDCIESDNYSVEAQEKRKYFLDQLKNLPSGISEIIIHCSVIHECFNPPDVQKRLIDLEFFTSSESEHICRLSRIYPVDWRDI